MPRRQRPHEPSANPAFCDPRAVHIDGDAPVAHHRVLRLRVEFNFQQQITGAGRHRQFHRANALLGPAPLGARRRPGGRRQGRATARGKIE
jgi:hypothetical protein